MEAQEMGKEEVMHEKGRVDKKRETEGGEYHGEKKRTRVRGDRRKGRGRKDG